MADKEIEVFPTAAEQVTDVLKLLGVPKERMITVMIEPDDWLTIARQESRRLVISAGLSDDDIDRIKRKSSRVLDEAGCRHQRLCQRRPQGEFPTVPRRPLDRPA
jgi:hypothetical protein